MMPTGTPERGFAPLILLCLAFASPAAAQQAARAPGAIHGRITVTRRDEARPAPMRDQMFGMYSMHGAEGAPLQGGTSPTASVRLSERAVV